jgi:hypothetical protein
MKTASREGAGPSMNGSMTGDEIGQGRSKNREGRHPPLS